VVAFRLRRRDLLVAGVAVPLVAGWTDGAGLAAGWTDGAGLAAGWTVGAGLAQGGVPARAREWVHGGVVRDGAGGVVDVFGLAPDEAGEILLRASKTDALPDGYAPADLVSAAQAGIPSAGRQLLRARIVGDTQAMIGAAAADGFELYVGSGFRSQAYQMDVFAAQVARWGDADTANRYSARPGHSQHQLGTTIDFATDFRAFRGGGSADWLRDHAHQFGFVVPYTVGASQRTGYVDEPWHGRWLGRRLADRLHAAGYLEWTDLTVDDVVALTRMEAALDD
jgi:zinc D-Ala-D-Ala carboxypeptidase